MEFAASAPPRVPPPLALDSPARVVVEFGASAGGLRCSLGLRVALHGEPCLLPLALWTGDLQTYRRYREALRVPAFLGEVGWDGDRWSLAIAGREAYSARPGRETGEVGQGSAGLPWATYRHALRTDWTQGPIDGPAELWVLAPAQDSRSRELRTKEVATSGSLDGWVAMLGASGPTSASSLAGLEEPKGKFAHEIDPASLEPFALRNYPGGSLGVIAADTSYLEPNDLEAYRSRREIRLNGVMLVAVDATVARASVERLLPPPCVALQTAVVRVMTVRGLDDPGLDEAWLFAQCLLEDKRVWYAVSHIRGSISGSEFGREVLGYPTKAGAMTATLGANRFSASIRRGDSSLYQADGFYGGFSTGTSLADMPVATLRLRLGRRGATPTGELMTQPWYYQGLRKPVRRESLFASFPDAESDARPSAWSRMGPANAYWATVFDSATLQRLPGVVVAQVEDVAPYYRDRCDGRLPWENPAGAGDPDASD